MRKRPANPALARPALEPVDVGVHHRLHVGVEAGGRPALVLARERERSPTMPRRAASGKRLSSHVDDRQLVRGIDVRVQQAHGDARARPLARRPSAAAARAPRASVEQRLAHRCRRWSTRSSTSKRNGRGTSGGGKRDAQVEEVVALLHRDVEHVAKSARDDHGRGRAATLDHRIGHERGAVHDHRHVGRRDAGLPGHREDAVEHRFLGRLGRGERLVRDDLVGRASSKRAKSVKVPPMSIADAISHLRRFLFVCGCGLRDARPRAVEDVAQALDGAVHVVGGDARGR